MLLPQQCFRKGARRATITNGQRLCVEPVDAVATPVVNGQRLVPSRPPSGLALDGVVYAPLRFAQATTFDYADIKSDTAGAPGPAPPDASQAACMVIPNAGTYSVVVFVWERSTGAEYELSLYRNVLDDVTTSVLVGTVARSAATATAPGATSTTDDVVRFDFPATAYSADDVVTVGYELLSGAAPVDNLGGMIVLGGASL